MPISLKDGFRQSVEALDTFFQTDTTANLEQFNQLVTACDAARTALVTNNETPQTKYNSLFETYSNGFLAHEITVQASTKVDAYQEAYNAYLESLKVTGANDQFTTRKTCENNLQTAQKAARLAIAKLQKIDHPQAPNIKKKYKVLLSGTSALNLSSGKVPFLFKKLVSKTYSALKTALPLLALTASAAILSKSFGNEVPYEKMAQVGRIALDTTTSLFFQNVPTLFIRSANMITEGGTRLGNALQGMGTRLLTEKGQIQNAIDFVPNSPLSQKVFAAGTLTTGIFHLLDRLGLHLNLRIPGTRQSFSLVRTVKRVATAVAFTPFLVGGYLAFVTPLPSLEQCLPQWPIPLCLDN